MCIYINCVSIMGCGRNIEVTILSVICCYTPAIVANHFVLYASWLPIPCHHFAARGTLYGHLSSHTSNSSRQFLDTLVSYDNYCYT